jgi:hypothetical protein
MTAPARVPPWVLVAGDFRFTGGMDKANAHLARAWPAAARPCTSSRTPWRPAWRARPACG